MVCSCGRIGYDPLVASGTAEAGAGGGAGTGTDARLGQADGIAASDVPALTGDAPAPSSDGGVSQDGGGSPLVDSRAIDGVAAPVSDAPVVVAPPDAPVAVSDVAAPLPDAAPPPAPDAPPLAPDAPPPAPDVAPDPTCAVARPNALLCEDFEGSLPAGDPPYSIVYTAGSSATISSTRVYQGRGALRVQIKVDPGGGASFARMQKILSTPLTSGALHMRAFLYVPSGFTVQNWLVLLQAGNSADKLSFDMAPAEAVAIDDRPGNVYLLGPARALPRDRWACVEFVVEIARRNLGGYMELFIDGRSVVRSATGITTLPAAGVTDLHIGVVHSYGVSPDYDIFIDGVVVDRGPIGCN